MTVGEKIQLYRKKIGLSQEELGQQLLVSRQTVSLWEMDKTLPTVDNLMRLKEIFSVSLDDLLCGSEQTEDAEEKPKEAYVFEYEKKELQEIFKHLGTLRIKPLLPFVLVFAPLSLCLLVADAPAFMIGLLLGSFLLGLIFHVKGYFAYKKAWKKSEDRILQSRYSYEVFDEYFVLRIFHNGEAVKIFKIGFDDIKRIQDLGAYLVLHDSAQLLILKKDALLPTSAFFALRERASDRGNASASKGGTKKPPRLLRVLSILLFVLSICTLFGAMVGIAMLANDAPTATRSMWVFFLFLPIPIASVIFGFCLRRKGYAHRKNVIVGCIMAAILCIYGSFSFRDDYLHSDAPILEAEQLLQIDIPQHSRIDTQSFPEGTQSARGCLIYSVSSIYFQDAAVEEFEAKLAGDPAWMSAIPSDMLGVTSPQCETYAADYYIIYNKDTKERNLLPSVGGRYEWINLFYSAESNTMWLVEYQREYVK